MTLRERLMARFRMNPKRWILVGCVVIPLLLILLNGCATTGEGWYRSNRPALEVEWWAAGYDNVQTFCQPAPGWTSNACALYSSICLIIAEREEVETPPWLAKHERKHCAGEDHPGPTLMPNIRFTR